MSCSAILVNYHGAALIADAARSLADDPACQHIHVLDNSVCEQQAELLQQSLPATVQLTICRENLGFAAACNLAFADSKTDFVLLLNPDARLLPGALSRLLDFLATHPRAAAVGPRVYWDEERQFLLPPTTYPSRTAFLLDRLGDCLPRLRQYRAGLFRQRALREWQATRPFQVDALSGGHVLLRRSAVEAAGGLFDPRFFMYWEDSDLMRRLQDCRFSLWLEPAAEAIHLYEHSPGKDKLIADGWPVFANKYFASTTWRRLTEFARHRYIPGGTAACLPIDAPPNAGDISLPVPEAIQSAWLLEFSPSPSLVPAMGRLGTGSHANLPLKLAQRFANLPGFLRLGPVTSTGEAQHFVIPPQAAR